MNFRRIFGTRDFWKHALRLAIPISLQNILVSSFTLVDTVMIGGLGDTALASVGMAGQWAWLLALILFGFNSGAGVFIAQYWGVRDVNSIRKSFGLATASALTVSLIFTGIALFAPALVLARFTSDPLVSELGCTYLRYACFSYVAICLNNLFGTLLRSTEEVKLPLYVSMISVLLNAGLNALFIYVLDMGVRGAALATSISAWFSPILIFIISVKRRNILFAPLRSFIGWSKGFVKKYYWISIPALANETIWALGTVLYRSIFSNADTDFYAALTICQSIIDITFAFFVGLCHACAVIVGKKVGAGDLKEAFSDGCRFCFLFPFATMVISALFLAGRPLLLMPFTSSDPSTLAIASRLIFIYLLWLPIRNIPYITIVGTFRAGGDTKIGLIYDCLGLWGLAVPVVWLGATVFNLDLVLVYLLMMVAEDLPKSTLCILRLLSKKWIRPVTEQGSQALGE